MNIIDSRLNEIIDCLYRVSAKAIIIKDRKMLMTFEDDGWYSLPGGGIDHGEEIEVGLLREVEEEIGLSENDIRILPGVLFVTMSEVLNGIPRIQIHYKAELLTDQQIEKKELTYKWVGVDELQSLTLSPALGEIRTELAKFL